MSVVVARIVPDLPWVGVVEQARRRKVEWRGRGSWRRRAGGRAGNEWLVGVLSALSGVFSSLSCII